MRASSGPWVRVAKTYRDETKWKCRLLARSQWPSSTVEDRILLCSTAGESHCDLAESLHFCFVSSLYVLAMFTRGPDDALIVLGKCCSVTPSIFSVCSNANPLHYYALWVPRKTDRWRYMWSICESHTAWADCITCGTSICIVYWRKLRLWWLYV